MLLQVTSKNQVMPAEMLPAEMPSYDVRLEISTCDVPFAETETGANIEFEIADQWTDPLQILQVPARGIVGQAVRLSGWPSKLRIGARGDDAWCIEGILLSTGDYNATILPQTAGDGQTSTESIHWIRKNAAKEYAVPPLPEKLGSHRGATPEILDAAVTENQITESSSSNASVCTTRFDERVSSLGYETATPGTPCLFGLDARDEGKHCIFDDGYYGSLGWCYTKQSMEAWGACGESCPLWGQQKILGKKLDKILKTMKNGHTAITETLRLAMLSTTTTSTVTNATTNKTNDTNDTSLMNTTSTG